MRSFRRGDEPAGRGWGNRRGLVDLEGCLGSGKGGRFGETEGTLSVARERTRTTCRYNFLELLRETVGNKDMVETGVLESLMVNVNVPSCRHVHVIVHLFKYSCLSTTSPLTVSTENSQCSQIGHQSDGCHPTSLRLCWHQHLSKLWKGPIR